MNRRQKIIISVTGIILVLLILVGLTYAYFLTQIQGNDEERSISVTTANLVVEYGDGNNILAPTNKIMPDDVVGTKTFTVTNKGNDTSNYVVVIEDVVVTNATTNAATTFETNDFVYTLTCDKYNRTEYEANPSTAVSTGTCNVISTETEFPLTGGLVVRDEINVGEVYLYGLTLTYKDNGNDQSNDMNKTLSAKVNIKNEEEYITLAGTVETTFKKSKSINLTTAEAIEDWDIDSKALVYPFTVENTGATHQNITIKLTDIEMDSVLKNVDFRWGLFNVETGNGLSYGVFEDIENNEILVYRDTIIDAGEEARDYQLKIWVHNDGSGNANLLNKSFKANLSVTGQTIEYTSEECFTFNTETNEITGYDYENCSGDVVIPKTINGHDVIKVGYGFTEENGFYLSDNLKSLIIPNTVTEIKLGGYPFEHLTIPESLISTSALGVSSHSVPSIMIPDTVIIDGAGGSSWLGDAVVLPKTIFLPKSMDVLESWVVYGGNVKNVIIPYGVTTIESYAIAWTNDLKSIEIPSSVVSIGKKAFDDSSIEEIIVRGKTEVPEGFEEDWNCVRPDYDDYTKCSKYATVTFRP